MSWRDGWVVRMLTARASGRGDIARKVYYPSNLCSLVFTRVITVRVIISVSVKKDNTCSLKRLDLRNPTNEQQNRQPQELPSDALYLTPNWSHSFQGHFYFVVACGAAGADAGFPGPAPKYQPSTAAIIMMMISTTIKCVPFVLPPTPRVLHRLFELSRAAFQIPLYILSGFAYGMNLGFCLLDLNGHGLEELVEFFHGACEVVELCLAGAKVGEAGCGGGTMAAVHGRQLSRPIHPLSVLV